MNKNSTFCLYDKRNSFPFSIVQMSYLSSNVPFKIKDASLRAKILRIGRTITDFNKFKTSCETLISRIINQGAKLKSIEQYFCKIPARNFDTFVKVANTYENFVNVFLPYNYIHINFLLSILFQKLFVLTSSGYLVHYAIVHLFIYIKLV